MINCENDSCSIKGWTHVIDSDTEGKVHAEHFAVIWEGLNFNIKPQINFTMNTITAHKNLADSDHNIPCRYIEIATSLPYITASPSDKISWASFRGIILGKKLQFNTLPYLLCKKVALGEEQYNTQSIFPPKLAQKLKMICI